MPRKPEGLRPLTAAERQARRRKVRSLQLKAMRLALEQIAAWSTDTNARKLAEQALAPRAG